MPEGAFVVGSDESCDVILHDEFIAARHVRITIAGNTLSGEPLDGSSVLIAGQPATGKFALNPYQYFTLGNTHIALGSVGKAWPRITFPEFQLNSPSNAAEEAAAANPDTPVEPASPADTQSKSGYKWTGWELLALSLLLFIGLGVYLWGPFGRDNSKAELPALAIRIKTVLQAHQVEDTVKAGTRSGKVAVEGYLTTKAKRQALEQDLRKAAPGIGIRIRDNESLAAAVRDVLSVRRLRLNVAGRQPGEIVVSGTIPNETIWEAAKRQISEDVPALRLLTSNVVTPGNPMLVAQNQTPNATAGKPEPTWEPIVEKSTPTTSTKETPDESEDPVTTTKEASTNTANPAQPPPVPVAENVNDPIIAKERPVPLQTFLIQPLDKRNGDEPLRLELKSIQIGNTRSMVLADGQRVFEGAMLRSGHRVKNITADAITLTKSSRDYIIAIGEPR